MPIDFMIFEMKKDKRTPIIPGRPFLATAGCRLMSKTKLSSDVEDEHMESSLIKASKFPSISSKCHRIDVVDRLV